MPPKGTGKGATQSLPELSDVFRYRSKYKELKRKIREMETDNERLHLKTLRVKRNIQRMRLERAILYERLESDLAARQGQAASTGSLGLSVQSGPASHGQPMPQDVNMTHAGPSDGLAS
ncbi:unnamed protein product [Tilletia controversa]|uniref:INO80 complex subunit F domain-containing protein n=3 Tax=Tilletia TaxID=13289 RepID=A0A8X7T1L8_9BASI|nr:hypothetical protein CF336_g4169 [Tilletia laevis]KAE8199005.1 hypothetical protein CF328_g3374 [Tilletia controversa]KAE8256968.1 hypothetical protein A4X03_0g4875 [Tilletia caries]KAE8202595.1 hypothetical protein CF335_g3356 [Tilletia laevis]KAE8256221.1 hypothetical protein A4X06_0g33 [Tilletia controversa]